MIAPAIKATSPDPSRRALLWVQYSFPRPRKASILATALPLWIERNGEPFCPKTLVFAVFPAAVCFPCHCEPRSGVAISCWLVPASFIIPCHCEARRAVAIRFPYSFIYEKRTKRSTDCQEVNCPEGAREATLGCGKQSLPRNDRIAGEAERLCCGCSFSGGWEEKEFAH